MDKVKHFIVSAAIVIVGAFIFNLWVGVILSAAVGLYKEYFKDKVVDYYDLLADALGIATAIWVCLR